MEKEIFIHEWKIQDYAGRREPTMKSEGTINGEHVYACKNLTSWFRLGKYLIKHDHANYLLGLLDLMERHEYQGNVKWLEWDKETSTNRNARNLINYIRLTITINKIDEKWSIIFQVICNIRSPILSILASYWIPRVWKC